MKARIKDNGEEVDVTLLHPKEYIEIACNENGRRIFNADNLIIDELVDWSAFRREAAKDAMSGILANYDEFRRAIVENYRPDQKHTIPVGVASLACACADELIKVLKEEKK